MIFVTVGTHEQQFDRLVKKIDELKKEQIIKDDVFIQTGFSKYKPKYCEFKEFISFEEVNSKIKEARIVITHGGPSSFIPVLQNKKVPIVVPRNSDLLEHVNNHQLDFVKQLELKNAGIIPVYNIDELGEIIKNYDYLIKNKKHNKLNNNKNFCNKLEKIINELF